MATWKQATGTPYKIGVSRVDGVIRILVMDDRNQNAVATGDYTHTTGELTYDETLISDAKDQQKITDLVGPFIAAARDNRL